RRGARGGSGDGVSMSKRFVAVGAVIAILSALFCAPAMARAHFHASITLLGCNPVQVRIVLRNPTPDTAYFQIADFGRKRHGQGSTKRVLPHSREQLTAPDDLPWHSIGPNDSVGVGEGPDAFYLAFEPLSEPQGCGAGVNATYVRWG